MLRKTLNEMLEIGNQIIRDIEAKAAEAQAERDRFKEEKEAQFRQNLLYSLGDMFPIEMAAAIETAVINRTGEEYYPTLRIDHPGLAPLRLFCKINHPIGTRLAKVEKVTIPGVRHLFNSHWPDDDDGGSYRLEFDFSRKNDDTEEVHNPDIDQIAYALAQAAKRYEEYEKIKGEYEARVAEIETGYRNQETQMQPEQMSTGRLMRDAMNLTETLYEGIQNNEQQIACAQVSALLAIANELKRANNFAEYTANIALPKDLSDW